MKYIILPLNSLVLLAEGNFTRSCGSKPTNFTCAHIFLRWVRLQLDEM